MGRFFWGWFVGFQSGMAILVLFTTPLHTIKEHWIELCQRMFL